MKTNRLEKNKAKKSIRFLSQKKGKNSSPRLQEGSADAKQLLHKLKHHQESLEIQNEYLRENLGQLKKSRDSYVALYDFAPITYIDFDSKGCIKQINITGSTLLGMARTFLIGLPFINFVAPQDVSKFLGHLTWSLEKKSKATELFLRVNSQLIPVQLLSKFSKDESLGPLCRTVIMDLTERKKMETALRASEERFRIISELSSDFAYSFGLNEDRCVYNWVTGAVARITGYSDQEFIEGGWERIILSEDQPIYQNRMEELKRGRPFSAEFRIRKKNGEIRWINDQIIPANNHPQFISYFYGATQDITDRKRIETELREAYGKLEIRVQQRTVELRQLNQELLRSNKELSDFAYVASHDLQEPLRMVKSYTQLLARKFQDQLDEDVKVYIDFITQGATRMQDLIHDVLTYSQIGRKHTQQIAIQSEETLKHVVHGLRLVIEEEKGVITYDPLPMIQANPIELTQLFQNLISNALKFHGDKPPRIHVSARRKENMWIFSIGDEGIGIDPQYQGRIFTMFQRLHERNEYPGTGIGLAICKKIVESHNGQIWVESKLEAGSTFYFALPA